MPVAAVALVHVISCGCVGQEPWAISRLAKQGPQWRPGWGHWAHLHPPSTQCSSALVWVALATRCKGPGSQRSCLVCSWPEDTQRAQLCKFSPRDRLRVHVGDLRVVCPSSFSFSMGFGDMRQCRYGGRVAWQPAGWQRTGSQPTPPGLSYHLSSLKIPIHSKPQI